MMKRLLFALLALLAATPAQAAITFVDAGFFAGGQFGGTGSAVNAASATLGVVVVGAYDSLSSTVAVGDDSGYGNVWVRRTHHVPGGTMLDIWDCPACTFTNGMHVHVREYTGGSIYLSHGEAFYSGTNTAAYGAAAAGAGPANAPIQPGALTAPGNGYLYITGVSISGVGDTASINSGFTIRAQTTGVSSVNVGFALADNIQATAAALNPTWSGLTASDNLADMAYWAPAGAPPPPTATPQINTNIFN